MFRYFILFFSLLVQLAYAQVEDSPNTRGIQAGRDITSPTQIFGNVTYNTGLADASMIATGFKIAGTNKNSTQKILKANADSLDVYCNKLLLSNDSLTRSIVMNLIVVASTSTITAGLEDKDLNVVNYLKQAVLDIPNVVHGGTCETYTYQEKSFRKGQNFIKLSSPYDNGFALQKIVSNNLEQVPKFGMINRNGELILAIIYDTIYGVSEGYILARVGSYGFYFFDTLGRKLPINVSNCSDVRPFSCGVAKIVRDGHAYFIDKSGNEVPMDNTPFMASAVFSVSEDVNHNIVNTTDGYYKLHRTKKGFLFRKVPTTVDGGPFNKQGFAVSSRYTIIDTNFSAVSKAYKELKKIGNSFLYNDSQFDVIILYGGNRLYGIMDSWGKELTGREPRYTRTIPINDNYWIVYNRAYHTSLLNSRGHELMPFSNQTIEFLSDNLVRVFNKETFIETILVLDELGNATDANDCP